MAPAMTPIRLTLKQAREVAGLTQAELANAVGVRQATISDLETGKSGRIDLELIDRLCEVLRIEPAELIARDAKRRPKGR
jgi:transcriptional regulator with XRE-family HTH domain